MLTRDVVKNLAEGVMYNMIPLSIFRHVPQGVDLFYDLKKIRPNYYPRIVFDVGANVGQTVLKWNRFFPHSTYYCFEPVKRTYDKLVRNVSGLANVSCYHCALGAEEKTGGMTLFEDSRLNTLHQSTGDPNRIVGKEDINIHRLDDVCDQQNIGKIDFLKIDTEGFDVEVLKGACRMLEQHRISFIQVEAGMNPFNHRHVSFRELEEFMGAFGYVLFGIYGQHLEWNGAKRLRMSNPVFISPDFDSRL